MKRDTSIEAIASYYLQKIRQVQARDPYFLGGYCVGGIIAFEMAQQLRAAGEEVALLVMFESYNPDRPVRLSTIGKGIWLESSGLPPLEKLRYIVRRIAAILCQNAYGGLLPLKLPIRITLNRATANCATP